VAVPAGASVAGTTALASVSAASAPAIALREIRRWVAGRGDCGASAARPAV
jgi:hypothetical protein